MTFVLADGEVDIFFRNDKGETNESAHADRGIISKNKLAGYLRLEAKPCWSPTGIASSPNSVRPRGAAAHWFRMRFCSMPFARDGSGHRYWPDGKCRHESR
jgi:hypothetical protein